VEKLNTNILLISSLLYQREDSTLQCSHLLMYPKLFLSTASPFLVTSIKTTLTLSLQSNNWSKSWGHGKKKRITLTAEGVDGCKAFIQLNLPMLHLSNSRSGTIKSCSNAICHYSYIIPLPVMSFVFSLGKRTVTESTYVVYRGSHL
jgi:hypothetical protein